MREFGVKTLVFSDGNTNNIGTYTKIRFRDYNPMQKSLGRYYIEQGYKQVYRIPGTTKIQDSFGNIITENYLLDDDK
jgi:hypothetical protein